MKWVLDGFKKGKIVRTKVNNSFFHYGLIIDDNKVIQYGKAIDSISKPAHDVEVLITTLDEFNNGFIEVCKYSFWDLFKKNRTKKAIKLAMARLGEKKYDFLKNNCEHFVNDCVFNKHRSRQIDSMREHVKKKHKLLFKKDRTAKNIELKD